MLRALISGQLWHHPGGARVAAAVSSQRWRTGSRPLSRASRAGSAGRSNWAGLTGSTAGTCGGRPSRAGRPPRRGPRRSRLAGRVW